MPSQADTQMMVLGYVRVSTDNQLENYSIDEQMQRIAAYCKAKGWTLLKIYTDGGFSGGNTNRPALKQMLGAIRQNHVDAVVVYKLDRLSRSQKDTLTLIEDEFLAQNVDFVSINENFDTSTPFGRAMIGILSVFAQLEKDQITERFTMGRIGRSKAGYYHGGGFSPMGYDYENGELVVNEYQALQVREIYTKFLNGKSINAIWHSMASTYGGHWSAAKIRLILLNSTYTGKVKFAGVEYDGKHTPIINDETFASVQELLFSDGRESGKTTPQKTPFRAKTLLSGLVFCSRCGAKYAGCHGYYKCYSRSKGNRELIVDPNCKNENWPIDELDRAVTDNIRAILASKKLFAAAVASGTQNEVVVDVKAITKRINETDTQMSKLIDLYQLGSIPMEALTQRINVLNTEKTILQKQLEVSRHSLPERTEQFKENARLFAEKYDISPLETKRLLISSMVESVWIKGSSFDVKWRV